MEKRKRSKPTARECLVAAAHHGDMTLVLGSGMSVPRGVPSWEALAKRLWAEVFPQGRSPWRVAPKGRSPHEVPQFLPIVFELVCRAVGEEKFHALLYKHLYANVKYPWDSRNFRQSRESLAVIARLIVQEQQRYKRESKRRIDAVITLNADDLIEQAVNAVAGVKKPRSDRQIVRTVARSTHYPLGGLPHSPLPVYHIHGFLPSNYTIEYGDYYEHMLVFTDMQYWSTSASDVSFANRVMATALGEGSCIFIGLSMTDINLLRWLALRGFEKDRDIEAAQHPLLKPDYSQEGSQRQPPAIEGWFERHFWIRPAVDDPSGFLSNFLKLRGVKAVEMDGWKGEGFQMLIEECFPSET